MGLIHIFTWILLNIYYISAQYSLKEKTTSGYSHCKTSISDKVCSENIKDCCPARWKLVDETCYYFEQYWEKSLIEAEKYCKGMNASIFTPNSLEEIEHVFQPTSKYTSTWIGIRKECQDKPDMDIYGKINMSTLNWNNDPYIEDYANISMFLCDAVGSAYYSDLTVTMMPCGRKLRFICERRPEPDRPATDAKDISPFNNLEAKVSTDSKSKRTARMIPMDVTPDHELNSEDLMNKWHPERPADDDDGISSEEEMRRYLSDHDTKRIFFEELVLNRTESGEDERFYTVNNIAREYTIQELRTNGNKEAYEKKLRLLKEGTRNLGIDISSAEMNLKRNISLYENLLETLGNCKKTFCATLARVKKERYLKSLTKEGN